jgi:MFS family permease
MRRLVALCCAVILLDTAFFAVLAPLLPSLKADHALSESQLGVLSGIYAAGVLVFALPGGWFAARFGPRAAVIGGLIAIGVFTPLFGMADGIWLLDVSRFAQGAGGALLWAGAMSWVIAGGPIERRGALIGTLVAAATVGEMIGAPLGGLAHSLGIELVFAVVGVLAAILCLFALTIEPPVGSAPQPLAQAIKKMRDPALAGAVWMLGAAALAFGVVIVMLPLRLDALGGSPMLIAGSFAMGSIIEALLGPRVGRLSDRVGRALPYHLGAAAAAAGIFGIALIGVQGGIVAAMALFAFGAAFAFTPSMAMTADRASARELDQGYAAGLSNMAFGGGQMLGSIGAGALAAGGYLLGAVLAGLALGSAALLARR